MNNDIFSEISMMGIYLKSLNNTKNIFKKIKSKLIAFKILIKLSNMVDKISPYYEWYSNAIKFIEKTNYTSDILKNVKYTYDSKLNIEVCSCDVAISDTTEFNIFVSIPMDTNDPSMKITISSNGNYFRHIDLVGYNIDHFIDDHHDISLSMSIYNCLKAFQNELYNSCKKYLLN